MWVQDRAWKTWCDREKAPLGLKLYIVLIFLHFCITFPINFPYEFEISMWAPKWKRTALFDGNSSGEECGTGTKCKIGVTRKAWLPAPDLSCIICPEKWDELMIWRCLSSLERSEAKSRRQGCQASQHGGRGRKQPWVTFQGIVDLRLYGLLFLNYLRCKTL